MIDKEALHDLQALKEAFEEERGVVPMCLEFAIKEQSMWIPVSERLPERSGEYLITGIGISPCIYQSFYYKNENVWSYKNLVVVAWMPLPEPYKVDVGGEENADR